MKSRKFGFGRGRFLKHYGMPRRSGRYPWGSGEKPQRNRNIYNVYKDLHKEGFTDKEIADQWGMSQNKLKAIKSIGRDQERRILVERAEKLEAKGYSRSEIARRMGLPNESSVRSLLNKAAKDRNNITKDTAEIVKKFCDDNKYIDIGEGTEIALGIKPSRMESVVALLEAQGYSYHKVYMDQMGTNYQTTIKCLVPPGVSYKELQEHKYDIRPVSDVVEDVNGLRVPKPDPVNNVDPSRLAVRYGDEGGKDYDGVIMIRRGCEDLNLGQAMYAQVRIGIGGTHYAKGMCVYGDDKDFPPGCDILVNSNKPSGTPIFGHKDNSVLKEQKSDPNNPFGASIKDEDKLKMVQKRYIGEDGETHVSALNIVNEEGDWGKWQKSLSSQFLSKQRVELAQQQLNQKYTDRMDEFNDICNLTNPTVKRVLLEKFADSCDSAAVDLKAAALPGQASQVLLPSTTLKENEIYAPNYDNGTRVVLVRYPHASITEIPQLVVNNNNAEARKMLGTHPTDAVCIHPKAAQQMSGADFDGDSALVIPANNVGGKVRIKVAPQFEDLKNFDTSEYKIPEGDTTTPRLSEKNKQKQMGVVSNLITDMTLQGAEEEHMVRAIKHSMVIIDAVKHELDYKKSERENDIDELKRLYQKRYDPDTGEEIGYGGASTIVSRAKSKQEVEERKAITRLSEYREEVDPKTGKIKKVGNVDPETGRIVQRPTEGTFTYINEKVKVGTNDDGSDKFKTKKLTLYTDYKTGDQYTINPVTKERKIRTPEEVEAKAKVQGRTQSSTKMAEAKDAFELTSGGSRKNPGHPMEGVYANYANQMKDLANRARIEYLKTPKLKQDKAAREEYDEEYKQLTRDLLKAQSNAPRERRATILANKEVSAWRADNPDADHDSVMKQKGKAIERARKAVGAKKEKIKITDREWEAIQKGAVSDSVLLKILNNTDLDSVKERAMPRTLKVTLSPTKEAKIKAMATSYTQAEIAKMLGLSTSQVSKVING